MFKWGKRPDSALEGEAGFASDCTTLSLFAGIVEGYSGYVTSRLKGLGEIQAAGLAELQAAGLAETWLKHSWQL
jgi:hypothetical protein